MRPFNCIRCSAALCILLGYALGVFGQVYDPDPSWTSADSNFTTSIAVGDLDGNDTLDIVACNYNYPYTKSSLTAGQAANWNENDFGDFLLVYWNGSTTPSCIDATRRGYEKVVLADLDNDDDLDLVVGCVNVRGNDGQNYFYINNGSRNFTRCTFAEDPRQDTHDIAVGDINNDGWMDGHC